MSLYNFTESIAHHTSFACDCAETFAKRLLAKDLAALLAALPLPFLVDLAIGAVRGTSLQSAAGSFSNELFQ